MFLYVLENQYVNDLKKQNILRTFAKKNDN